MLTKILYISTISHFCNSYNTFEEIVGVRVNIIFYVISPIYNSNIFLSFESKHISKVSYLLQPAYFAYV